jgi:hypothetical protein
LPVATLYNFIRNSRSLPPLFLPRFAGARFLNRRPFRPKNWLERFTLSDLGSNFQSIVPVYEIQLAVLVMKNIIAHDN